MNIHTAPVTSYFPFYLWLTRVVRPYSTIHDSVQLYPDTAVYNECTAIDSLNLVREHNTVPLYNIQLFISGSCPILVLTTVLGRPRPTDAKNIVKYYQGPTAS